MISDSQEQAQLMRKTFESQTSTENNVGNLGNLVSPKTPAISNRGSSYSR